ncbi:hypothetical protein C9374_014608 [Naegleria lovaniensis]|uniref:Uncharacterized protein n=1 Tax=Naegleria lovaniensis TaxID=51637 RepID=A0AA88GZE2_NAELO|nr:uncharacterized protein C9374_014608 [Naegleria lovaniensis]KAG2389208.1 hypothetical protein C9374_014608 [Naegleria lovaniensis]
MTPSKEPPLLNQTNPPPFHNGTNLNSTMNTPMNGNELDHHVQATVNSSLFIIAYFIVVLFIVLFSIREWRVSKSSTAQKNQLILYALVAFYLFLQIIGVGFELIHNSAMICTLLNQSATGNGSIYQKGASKGGFSESWDMSSRIASISDLLIFLKLFQLPNLFVLMSFIQNIL